MKDTSHPGKHHEDRLFLRQTSSAPLQKDKAEGGTYGVRASSKNKLWVKKVAACLQSRDTASPQQAPRGRLLGALL